MYSPLEFELLLLVADAAKKRPLPSRRLSQGDRGRRQGVATGARVFLAASKAEPLRFGHDVCLNEALLCYAQDKNISC